MEPKAIWFLCLCGAWIWLMIDTERRLRKIGDTADRIIRRMSDMHEEFRRDSAD